LLLIVECLLRSAAHAGGLATFARWQSNPVIGGAQLLAAPAA